MATQSIEERMAEAGFYLERPAEEEPAVDDGGFNLDTLGSLYDLAMENGIGQNAPELPSGYSPPESEAPPEEEMGFVKGSYNSFRRSFDTGVTSTLTGALDIKDFLVGGSENVKGYTKALQGHLDQKYKRDATPTEGVAGWFQETGAGYLGSGASFLAQLAAGGVVMKGAGLGVKGVQRGVQAMAGGLGALQEGGHGLADAMEYTDDDAKLLKGLGLDILGGLTESVGLPGVFNWVRGLKKGMTVPIAGLKSMLAESLQEQIQTVGHDATARMLYDAQRDIWANWGDAALGGGFAGLFYGTLAASYGQVRMDQARQENPDDADAARAAYDKYTAQDAERLHKMGQPATIEEAMEKIKQEEGLAEPGEIAETARQAREEEADSGARIRDDLQPGPAMPQSQEGEGVGGEEVRPTGKPGVPSQETEREQRPGEPPWEAEERQARQAEEAEANQGEQEYEEGFEKKQRKAAEWKKKHRKRAEPHKVSKAVDDWGNGVRVLTAQFGEDYKKGQAERLWRKQKRNGRLRVLIENLIDPEGTRDFTKQPLIGKDAAETLLIAQEASVEAEAMGGVSGAFLTEESTVQEYDKQLSRVNNAIARLQKNVAAAPTTEERALLEQQMEPLVHRRAALEAAHAGTKPSSGQTTSLVREMDKKERTHTKKMVERVLGGKITKETESTVEVLTPGGETLIIATVDVIKPLETKSIDDVGNDALKAGIIPTLGLTARGVTLAGKITTKDGTLITADHIILLAGNSNKRTIGHEVYHVAERIVLTEGQIGELRKEFGNGEKRAEALGQLLNDQIEHPLLSKIPATFQALADGLGLTTGKEARRLLGDMAAGRVRKGGNATRNAAESTNAPSEASVPQETEKGPENAPGEQESGKGSPAKTRKKPKKGEKEVKVHPKQGRKVSTEPRKTTTLVRIRKQGGLKVTENKNTGRWDSGEYGDLFVMTTTKDGRQVPSSVNWLHGFHSDGRGMTADELADFLRNDELVGPLFNGLDQQESTEMAVKILRTAFESGGEEQLRVKVGRAGEDHGGHKERFADHEPTTEQHIRMTEEAWRREIYEDGEGELYGYTKEEQDISFKEKMDRHRYLVEEAKKPEAQVRAEATEYAEKHGYPDDQAQLYIGGKIREWKGLNAAVEEGPITDYNDEFQLAGEESAIEKAIRLSHAEADKDKRAEAMTDLFKDELVNPNLAKIKPRDVLKQSEMFPAIEEAWPEEEPGQTDIFGAIEKRQGEPKTKFQLAEDDKAYLSAVESGDMQAAERMVEDAARRAGYTVGPVFHGSGAADITEFDASKAGTVQTSDWGAGTYFVTSQNKADYYREEAVVRQKDEEDDRLYEEYEAAAKRFETRPMHESLDLGFGTPKYKELKEYYDRWIDYRRKKREGGGGRVYGAYLRMKNPEVYQYVGITDPWLAGIAQANGRDSLVIVNEPTKPGETIEQFADEILVWSPEQIKSAEPVTRDEQGEVIPLSERFAETSPDIRFQLVSLHDDSGNRLGEVELSALTPDHWIALNNRLKALGYDRRRWKDTKEIIERLTERSGRLSGDQAEALAIVARLITDKPLFTKTEKDQAIANAKRIFGTTGLPTRAFGILPNGRMLDGSEPGGDGQRTRDHSEFARIIPKSLQDKRGEVDGATGYRDRMLRLVGKLGVIRWMPEGSHVMLYGRPTAPQLATIRRLFEDTPFSESRFSIDLYSDTHSHMSRSYDLKTTNPRKITADIQRYYLEGHTPRFQLAEGEVDEMGFYSTLNQAVNNLRPMKARGQDWINKLLKTQGVKRAEVYWSGLESWLRSQKGAVETEEIRAFLDRYNIPLQEKVFGDPSPQEPGARTAYMLYEDSRQQTVGAITHWLSEHPDHVRSEDRDVWARSIADMIDERQPIHDVASEYGLPIEIEHRLMAHATRAYHRFDDTRYNADPKTKYYSWTQTGQDEAPLAVGYREFLMMWPTEQWDKEEYFRASLLNTIRKERPDLLGPSHRSLETEELTARRVWTMGNLVEMIARDAPEIAARFGNLDHFTALAKPFVGAHWAEENVVSHFRVTDRQPVKRLAPRGALFLEEIQSDWHGSGRKGGYQTLVGQGRLKEIKRRMQKIREAFAHADGMFATSSRMREQTGRLVSRARDHLRKFQSALHHGATKDSATFDKFMRFLSENKSQWSDLAGIHLSELSADWGPLFEEYEMAPASSGFEDWTRSERVPTQELYDYAKDLLGEARATYWRKTLKGSLDNAREKLGLLREFDHLAEERAEYLETTPVGPYPKTEDWVALTLRRALMVAVKEGKDLAWSTGLQQNLLYGLEIHVKEIEWELHDEVEGKERAYDLTIHPWSGSIQLLDNIKESKLAEQVGTNVAVQILTDENGSRGAIDAEGLRMGGKPMRAFYDKMVVDIANKIFKRFGLRAEQRAVGFGPVDRSVEDWGESEDLRLLDVVKNDVSERFTSWSIKTNQDNVGRLPEEAPHAMGSKFWGSHETPQAAIKDFKLTFRPAQDVWYMEIPDAAREKILKERAPKYQLASPEDVPDLQPVAGRIDHTGGKRGVLDTRDLYEKFIDTWVDQLHPLLRMEREIKGRKYVKNEDVTESEYRTARLFNGRMGISYHMLEHGMVEFGDISKVIGPGMNEIVSAIADDGRMAYISTYMVALRAKHLSEQRSLETGIDPADADKAIRWMKKNMPDIVVAAEKMHKFQDQLLQYLVDSGGLSPGAAQVMRVLNPYYVPFYRIIEEAHRPGKNPLLKSERLVDLFSPVSKMKGGRTQIVDPMESIIKNVYTFVSMAEKQRVAGMIADNAGKTPKVEETPVQMGPVTQPVKNLVHELEKLGMKVNGQAAEEVVTFFIPRHQMPREDVVTIFRDGERKDYLVSREIWNVLTGMSRQDLHAVFKVLRAPAVWLRAGATLNPDFSIVRNPWRDAVQSLMYTFTTPIPGANIVKGMYYMMQDKHIWEGKDGGEMVRKWILAGGAHAAFVSMDRKSLRKKASSFAKQGGFKRIAGTIKNPIEVLRILSETMENVTRIGEFGRVYESEIKKGTPEKEAMARAAWASRRVTQDFAKMGSYAWGVNQISAFFAARIGGYSRLGTAFQERPWTTSARLSLLALASVALMLHNRKDPRWKEIPQWQKDLFWIVFTENHIWRIPKPFEVGTIFGSLPERIVDGIISHYEGEDARLGKRVLATISRVDVPVPMPTFFWPALHIYANKDWRHRKVIPDSETHLYKKYQYGPWTSEVSKIIGGWLNVSPRHIDLVVGGWTGGLGRYAQGAIDVGLKSSGLVDAVPGPAKGLEDWPGIRSLLIRYPTSGAESVAEFYEDLDKARKAFTSWKTLRARGNTSEAAMIARRDKFYLARRKGLESTARAMSGVRSQVKRIMQNRSLRPEDKRRQLKARTKRLVGLAQRAKLKRRRH